MFAAVFTAAFLFAGFSAALAVYGKCRATVLAGQGLAFSLALMMAFPALAAAFMGFGQSAQWVAAAAAAALGAGLIYIALRRGKKPSVSFDIKRDWPCLALTAALMAYCAYLLYTHTLRPESGGYRTGQCTYGDMPMHLAFMKSLAVQGKFPPVYSLLAGDVRMGYPFLCDSVSSSYLVLGMGLRGAYVLPALLALLCVFFNAYAFLERALRSWPKAATAFLLFFVGSGFGFAYFMDGAAENPGNFTRIFTAFYETPTNYVDQNVKWVNPVVDLLIPQRATLFGYALLFACLYMLYRAAFEGEKGLFLPLGLLAGAMPLVHTHSFLALGIISAVLLVRECVEGGFGRNLLPWLIYGGVACALALPQLFAFTFRQSSGEGFLRPVFNWANEGDNYFWFYIKNIGLVYLLLIPAFLNSDKDRRWLYCGGLAILLICEIVVFQPNNYDNNKLLYVWHFLGCLIVADLLVDIYYRLKGVKGRAYLAALTLAACTLGSVLTMAREAVSDYEQFNAASVEAADYVDYNAEPDALFLTAANHNNAVAALAGRDILCGSGSYLFYHGLDYAEQETAMGLLYQAPSIEMLRSWGVDYVYISDYERAAYDVDEYFFEQNCNTWYNDEGKVIIYRVET